MGIVLITFICIAFSQKLRLLLASLRQDKMGEVPNCFHQLKTHAIFALIDLLQFLDLNQVLPIIKTNSAQ